MASLARRAVRTAPTFSQMARAHSTATATSGRPAIGYLFTQEERARSNRINEMFALEPPFKKFASRMGEGLDPLIDAIKASELSNKYSKQAQPKELYVPEIPHLLPVARWARDNAVVRDVLIHDDSVEVKPRLSWYHPDDRMVPRGWFQEGLAADFAYYYKDTFELVDAPPVTNVK